ncbi:MAG: hypothetical protein R3B95_14265 [Nitrospirales bacterium]
MGGYLTSSGQRPVKTQSKSDTELKEVIMKGRSGTAMVGFEER